MVLVVRWTSRLVDDVAGAVVQLDAFFSTAVAPVCVVVVWFYADVFA